MIVEKISKEHWFELSKAAHLISFQTLKDPEGERIDFALLCVDKATQKPLGYLTAKEMDYETIYWQFGGVFPSAKFTPLSFKGYFMFAQWCKERYKRVTTYIENTNVPMLKYALQVGFKICGMKYSQGALLLQCTLEFDHVSK